MCARFGTTYLQGHAYLRFIWACIPEWEKNLAIDATFHHLQFISVKKSGTKLDDSSSPNWMSHPQFPMNIVSSWAPSSLVKPGPPPARAEALAWKDLEDHPNRGLGEHVNANSFMG